MDSLHEHQVTYPALNLTANFLDDSDYFLWAFTRINKIKRFSSCESGFVKFCKYFGLPNKGKRRNFNLGVFFECLQYVGRQVAA